MTENPRLRKLLAAALYEQARARVEKFAPERSAEIMARHDELYRPHSRAPQRPPVVASGVEDPAPAPVFAEPAVAPPSEAGGEVEAAARVRPAAVAARQQLCSGYAAVVPARRRCRKNTN